jgi:hypothetical protein
MGVHFRLTGAWVEPRLRRIAGWKGPKRMPGKNQNITMGRRADCGEGKNLALYGRRRTQPLSPFPFLSPITHLDLPQALALTFQLMAMNAWSPTQSCGCFRLSEYLPLLSPTFQPDRGTESVAFDLSNHPTSFLQLTATTPVASGFATLRPNPTRRTCRCVDAG